MRHTIHVKNLEAIAEMMDLDPQSDVHTNYSGRGMYGQECAGITTTDFGGEARFLLAAIELAAGQAFEEDDFMSAVFELTRGRVESILWDIFRDVRTDNMGYSTIHYWPDLEVVGLEPQEEDEDDE